MPKWYSFLNKKDQYNLVDNERIDDENLIICQQLENRKYARFRDHLDFNSYRRKVNYRDNCFYETILEKKFRKPYFDIDMQREEDIDENDIILKIKEAINKLLADKEVVILVYSSHTKKKFSFHLLIANYYFTNCQEGKKFYQKTVELVEEKYHSYIDSSVYKPTQQFRILNSHKFDKDNQKIFREELSENFSIPLKYKKFPAGLDNYLLQISLISNTAGCQYLNGFEEDKKINKVLEKGFSSTSDLEDILNIFYSIFSADVFEYHSLVDNDGNLLITFRRISPSYCQDCNRIHENENPFITVNGIYRNIYYYCRRKEGEEEKSGKYIGSLGPEIIPELSLEEIPRIINKVENDDEEFVAGQGMSIVNKMKKLTTKKSKPKPVLITDFLTI